MTFGHFRAAFAAIALLGASVAPSDIPTYDSADVQLGSGAIRTVFVIDWNDGKTPDTHSWGLASDTPLTVSAALQLLDTLEPRLDLNMTRYSFGDTVDLFAYDAERVTELVPLVDTPYTPGVNGALTHDVSSGYDGPADHLQTVSYDPEPPPFGTYLYYAFWTGTQGADDWGIPPHPDPDLAALGYQAGISDLNLEDGKAYGFSFGLGTSPPGAIPEPSSLALLVGGVFLLCGRRFSHS